MERKIIQIVPYDPNWPHIFEIESKLIKEALGDNCLEVHHIGSTAVPGLCAKPIIDIIVVVKKGENSVAQIEKIDFTYKGEWNIPFKFGFTKRGEHNINLHVFEENHPEIELNIIFRDHLRSNTLSRHVYARIKEELLLDETSIRKQEGHLFSAYTLGKDHFIRKILKVEEYKRHRFLKVTHQEEWENYHRIRKSQIFNPIGVIYNTNHPSITSSQAHHFILCQGCEISAVAHIEFLGKTDAALRSIATDIKFQSRGYGKEMMFWLEKWLKTQNIKILKIHSRLSAEHFYRKLGYIEMRFEEPSIQQHYINLGKIL